MDFSIKKGESLISGKMSIEKIRRLVHKNRLPIFLNSIGCLGADSRFTAIGVDLINVASPVAQTVTFLIEGLKELEKQTEENKYYSNYIENLIIDGLTYSIESIGRILGLLEREDISYWSYTFSQLSHELLILKDLYKSVDDCCGKNLKEFKKDCKKLINDLSEHISQIESFLKENKSKENIFQPIYEIYKEKLRKFNLSGDAQEQAALQSLEKILFYNKKCNVLTSPFPPFLLKGMDSQVIEKICKGSKKDQWLVFMGSFHTSNICDFLKKNGYKEEVLEEGHFLVGEKKYSVQDMMTKWSEVSSEIDKSGKQMQVFPCSAAVLEKVKESQLVN